MAAAGPGEAEAEALRVFTALGLSADKARETLKNEALSALLRQAAAQVRAPGP